MSSALRAGSAKPMVQAVQVFISGRQCFWQMTADEFIVMKQVNTVEYSADAKLLMQTVGEEASKQFKHQRMMKQFWCRRGCVVAEHLLRLILYICYRTVTLLSAYIILRFTLTLLLVIHHEIPLF